VGVTVGIGVSVAVGGTVAVKVGVGVSEAKGCSVAEPPVVQAVNKSTESSTRAWMGFIDKAPK
jgi:hypothetical protein